MVLKLYNTLSREKEPLPDQKKIRLFVCGPTVYDYLHIGNARTYLFFDFFAKYLRARGYDVEYLENITDVDDKIIARAMTDGKDTAAVARSFTETFLADMKALGVNAVTTYAPATDFISQIIAQVERLIDKGFAYKIDGDGWYFDIAKDPDYGKLSGRTAAQAEDGVSRIDDSVGKRNKGDFCLWKFSQTSLTDLEPRWPSALGDGRPGWHIEDTAISEFYFGPQYEIHGGGVDLKFPHHEAEIAQQESASGLVPFVKLWMHTGALTMDGKKMSKSAGNFLTIRDFLKAHPPEVLRWITLTHHYRSPLDYSEEAVTQAKNELERIYGGIHNLAWAVDDALRITKGSNKEESEIAPLERLKGQFEEALADDLNTSKAFAALREIIFGDYGHFKERLELLKEMDGFLGLGFNKPIEGFSRELNAKIAEKFEEYKLSRANKQFIQSDALRKELKGLGYEVRDTEEGSVIVKKFF
ncbi:MAG: cysteine--tRNA ligase [Candidatus Pacebacteria bacterium]|nr:cysteine--tRNA ligase [Candidatus Paceibacterota bacterium]